MADEAQGMEAAGVTEQTNLLPCPCCGSGARFGRITDEGDVNFGGHFISCIACGLTTELMFACGDDPKPMLAEKWNRRVPHVQ